MMACAFSVPSRIARLDHEVRNQPMHFHRVEETSAREFHEGQHGDRRIHDVELDLDRAAPGFDVRVWRVRRPEHAIGLEERVVLARRRRTHRRGCRLAGLLEQ